MPENMPSIGGSSTFRWTLSPHVDRRGDRLAHRRDVEVELVAGPARLHLRAARNVLARACGCCWRSGAAPRPCRACAEDRLRWAATCARRGAAVQRFSSCGARLWFPQCACFARPAFAAVRRRRQSSTRSAPAVPAGGAPPIEPDRRLHHRRPGRARLSVLVSRGAVAPAQVKSFNDYLAAVQVAGVMPTWQLLRTATSWQRLRRPAVRSSADRRMAAHRPDAALRPRLCHSRGRPGRAGLGYRNPALNECAGGAPESAHKHYSAIDMVPLRPITREADADACARSIRSTARPTMPGSASTPSCASTWTRPSSGAGTWTRRSPRECPPIVHPEDVASVGQPLPQPQAPAPTVAAAPTPDAPPHP